MPYRACVRHISGLLRPPDLGRRASAGRHTSWKTSSLVSLARSDSLPFWSFALKPFVLVGTTKPRIDESVVSPFVFAHTTAICAVEPFVIHILAPLSSHVPSFCSRAIEIMPEGFEPKSGSVNPKQPMISPD